MKITREVTSVVCDICHTTIVKRNVFLNDGSFQEDSFKQGEVDLCFSCAGKVLTLATPSEADLKASILTLKRFSSSASVVLLNI